MSEGRFAIKQLLECQSCYVDIELRHAHHLNEGGILLPQRGESRDVVFCEYLRGDVHTGDSQIKCHTFSLKLRHHRENTLSC